MAIKLRFAVTGSTGLLGNRLVRLLRGQGHEVYRVVRPDTLLPDEPGEVSLQWDPENESMDRDGFDGLDAVIHTGGMSLASKRWTPEIKQQLLQSRVGPTRVLARGLARLKKPPRALVSLSAAGYYGPGWQAAFKEEDGAGEDFLADICRQWEAAADPARAAGIRVVHPRLGVVLSPAGGALAKLLPLFRFCLGGPLGSGAQPFSWISLPDAVEALSWMARNSEIEGPVNLAAPQQVSQKEFAAALGRALSRPALLPAPAPILRLVVGEMADLALLKGQHLDIEKLLFAGFSFRHPDLEQALSELLDSEEDEEEAWTSVTQSSLAPPQSRE